MDPARKLELLSDVYAAGASAAWVRTLAVSLGAPHGLTGVWPAFSLGEEVRSLDLHGRYEGGIVPAELHMPCVPGYPVQEQLRPVRVVRE